jgi:hypothetical protein
MSRPRSATFLSALALLAGIASATNTDVVQRLLDQPAPVADWRAALRLGPEGQAPPDDAPIEALVAWWASGDAVDDEATRPSAAVRQRLLEYALAHPAGLPPLLRWLPESPDAFERLKALHDRVPEDLTVPADPGSSADDQNVRDALRRWLMTRTPHFRDDLVRAVKAAADAEEVLPAETMSALARLDWAAAEPVLHRLADGGEPENAVAALCELLEQYERRAKADRRAAARLAEVRDDLLGFAEDSATPAPARARAVSSLMASAWPGRDAWFLSLFEDDTFLEGEDDAPLCGPVRRDPDRWIPLLAERVGSPDRAVHNNAVRCLVQFGGANARIDALRPLLPWLSDPEWSFSDGRLHLIQSLKHVELPESIPGLLWVLRNDTDAEQADAATALAHYKAKDAAPALREAFANAPRDAEDAVLVGAMLALDALGADDVAAAMEACSREDTYQRGRDPRVNDPEPVRLGRQLAALKPGDAAVGSAALAAGAERLIARAAALRATEPAVADRLWAVLARWPVAVIDRDVLRRLRASADIATVQAAIGRADLMRANVRAELLALVEAGGSAGGVAAAVLADAEATGRVLAGRDADARRMLLACARLLRTPLPVAEVGRLMNDAAEQDPLLALAAERYLEGEDGREARRLVLARHPGEVRILGAPMLTDDEHPHSPSARLRAEMRRRGAGDADAAEEIYALLGGSWAPEGDYVIRVRGGIATLTIDSPDGKTMKRTLTHDELAGLRDLIATTGLEDLPPMETGTFDGAEYEYLHLTPAGGRRVFMNTPQSDEAVITPYERLRRHFVTLGEAAGFEARHAVEDKIPGARILLWDEARPVRAVWANGADVRVLVGPARRTGGGGDAWHAVAAGGGLGERVDPPAASAVPQFLDDVPERLRGRFPDRLNRHAWQVRAGDDLIRVGFAPHDGREVDGIWRCRRGREPVLVCGGSEFRDPVVAHDGGWAVAVRGDQDWHRANPIVRVNLATGMQHPIDVGPGEVAKVIAWVPTRRRVLIQWGAEHHHVRGDAPGYRLLDVATGKTEPVHGELGPLLEQSYRPLQPTGRPDEAWATGRGRTDPYIGRYDTKHFAFTPMLAVPASHFDSMDLWVDEPAGVAYVAVAGDLLRVPLAGP